jgi:type III pantothenate kinase
MILGLLFGNSSLRYGVFDAAAIRASGRIPWPALSDRGGELREVAREHGVRELVGGSVRDDFLPRVIPWLPAELPPITFARRDFPLPIENRYEKPDEAGTDRLLNAIAARERTPGSASLTVDFGTAISLTVVSAEGAFLGGLIAAGSDVLSSGLRASTPRLPTAEPRRHEQFIQRSTRNALESGFYWEIVAGVKAMIHGVRGELLPSPCRVLATGGGAEVFAPAIAELEEEVPTLTLEGLWIACRARH